MPPRPPSLSSGQLESICKILADTEYGLTGSEIERTLRQIRVRDTDPGITKWRRLFNALAARQNADGNGDRVFAFIRAAMDPARYVGAHFSFEARRTSINAVLALCGYEFGPDARFRIITAATTLGEAEARAHRLRAALSSRGVHPDVLAACRAELVEQNVFHAVLEACKSVAAKLRTRCGLTSDGAQLIDEALGGEAPRLRINAFQTDSEKSEQRGFSNLVKACSGCFEIRQPMLRGSYGL